MKILSLVLAAVSTSVAAGYASGPASQAAFGWDDLWMRAFEVHSVGTIYGLKHAAQGTTHREKTLGHGVFKECDPAVIWNDLRAKGDFFNKNDKNVDFDDATDGWDAGFTGKGFPSSEKQSPRMDDYTPHEKVLAKWYVCNLEVNECTLQEIAMQKEEMEFLEWKLGRYGVDVQAIKDKIEQDIKGFCLARDPGLADKTDAEIFASEGCREERKKRWDPKIFSEEDSSDEDAPEDTDEDDNLRKKEDRLIKDDCKDRKKVPEDKEVKCLKKQKKLKAAKKKYDKLITKRYTKEKFPNQNVPGTKDTSYDQYLILDDNEADRSAVVYGLDDAPGNLSAAQIWGMVRRAYYESTMIEHAIKTASKAWSTMTHVNRCISSGEQGFARCPQQGFAPCHSCGLPIFNPVGNAIPEHVRRLLLHSGLKLGPRPNRCMKRGNYANPDTLTTHSDTGTDHIVDYYFPRSKPLRKLLGKFKRSLLLAAV